MSTSSTETPITHLIQAVVDDNGAGFLALLSALMESVGVVQVVAELCLIIDHLGRGAHGDEWQSVVATASHFIEIAAAEAREEQGR